MIRFEMFVVILASGSSFAQKASVHYLTESELALVCVRFGWMVLFSWLSIDWNVGICSSSCLCAHWFHLFWNKKRALRDLFRLFQRVHSTSVVFVAVTFRAQLYYLVDHTIGHIIGPFFVPTDRTSSGGPRIQRFSDHWLFPTITHFFPNQSHQLI